jgi:hypothetical protein
MQRKTVRQILVLALLGLLYCGLAQKYRAYDVDNPWFLSFSYNACHGDIETDTFQGMRYPGGMDGVHLFGKLPAEVQCAVMNRTGWIPGSVVGLNTAFGLAALWLWWSSLQRLGYRESWITGFILLLGVTEPMVSMMEKARYEFWVFFLFSLALWLVFRGHELAAAFVAVPAVEAEPAGVIVVALVFLALMMRSGNRRRTVFCCCFAVAVGAALYLVLHPGAVHEITHAPHAHIQYVPGGTMYAYFIERRRRLPELAMFVVGAWLCWQQRKTITTPADRIAQQLALAAGGLFIVLPHPNVSYVVFAIPFFLWAALAAYDRARRLQWVPAIVFVGLLAQYAYLYKVNRNEGFRTEDFAKVRQDISDAAAALKISDSQLHVCGDYSLWFAHPQNYSTCLSEAPDAALWKANLFLCFDGPLQENGLSSADWLDCSRLRSVLPLRELSSVWVRGHLAHIYGRQ